MDDLTVNTSSTKGRPIKSLRDRGSVVEAEVSDKECEDYLKSVDEAKTDLQNVERLFNNALDPDLIEYAIYEEYAIKLRLSYLIKKAKEKKIKSEIITSVTDGI